MFSILRTFKSAILIAAFASSSLTAEEEPQIKELEGGRLQIGSVILNKKSREIRFPAVINLREGLLEFLIVHENGKIHESLFRTTISPTNLNLAFTLLRYKPSKELYRIPKEPGILTGNFYEEPPEIQKAAKISLSVEIEENGETKSYQVSDWIKHEVTAKAMPPTHWIYGGSEIYDGKYVPEMTGDIAAIFITNSAIINYPGKDNLNDEVWTTMTNRIPPLETNVTIVISPFEK